MSHPLLELVVHVGTHATVTAAGGRSVSHGAPAAASAATTGTTSAGAGAGNTVSVTSLMFQLVIGLGVVLGVIALVAKLLRGKAGLAMGAGRRQGALAVIGRQSLAKGSSVAVVRAGQRVFLLGITAQSVRRLGELDPADLEPGAEPFSMQTIDGANGVVATFPTTKQQRPTTTWTSTIEQLRELTVRRG